MFLIAFISMDVISNNKPNGINCTQIKRLTKNLINNNSARLIVALTFLFKLFIVSCCYGQIVRHVRKTFSQRKARG